MNNEKNDEVFIRDLVHEFPQIKDEVFDEAYLGLTSLQIGCFTRFTQQAINSKNIELIKKCFLFTATNFDLVSTKIRNSLYISYLGKLEINNNVSTLLPPKLKKAKTEMDNY